MIDFVEILIDRLLKKNLTLAVAESCTGGMISNMLTEKPGASRFYMGSVTAYSNYSKEVALGVSHTNILVFGAVSEEVAREMADGAKALFGTDISVAVTGIAGPGGGTTEKPVGLVYIAVANRREITVSEYHFNGDRDSIRRQIAEMAIRMLIDAIE